jgi:hypothetical protein
MEDWGKGSGLVRSPPPVLYGSGTRLRLNRNKQTLVNGCCLFLHQRSLINAPEPARTPTGHFNSDPSADISIGAAIVCHHQTRYPRVGLAPVDGVKVIPLTILSPLELCPKEAATGGTRGNPDPGGTVDE